MKLEVQRTDLSYERVNGIFTVRKVNGEETQCIEFSYVNEIDLRHPIIEYYTKHDKSFDDVIYEINRRQITSVIILTSWRIYLDKDMLAKLFNDEFVRLDPFTFRSISRPNVVGYIVDRCETINDRDTMNDGLDLMLHTYSKKHNFLNIRDCRKDSYIVYPINMRRVDD